ncbi:MAG: hypothetical protein QOD86_2239 [Miltoncostaeaceae bacterium]|jgi:hypothetical protein|nr:hypothetical protein [Miltoncostaeaceae bacterium]
MSRREMGERLEMLLVMQWLDEGAREDGEIVLSVPTAASELGLDGGREGLLAIMGALGDLEDRKLVSVAWPGGAHAGGEALVALSAELRRDAGRLFGRA